MLSWQVEEGSKHREHRRYLEESRHAAPYIADHFGMMAAEKSISVETRTRIGHGLLWDPGAADWYNGSNGTGFQHQQKLWGRNIRCWFESGS